MAPWQIPLILVIIAILKKIFDYIGGDTSKSKDENQETPDEEATGISKEDSESTEESQRHVRWELGKDLADEDNGSTEGSQPKKSVTSDEVEESYRSHKQAGQREAPVDLGKVYEILITDETYHHSGRRDLIGKYEGFVIFVINSPEKVGPGNVANVKVTSFNKGGTSAQAKFIESVF